VINELLTGDISDTDIVSATVPPPPLPPPFLPPPPVEVVTSESADKDAKNEEFATSPVDRNAQVRN